jgi:SAM-dependent methyltransferase
MLKRPFRPLRHTTRMRNEGDVLAARDAYYSSRHLNLPWLVRSRYEWMNSFIKEEDRGLDIGCGAGFSRDILHTKNLLLADYAYYDFLDVAGIDAMETPFVDQQFDVVVATHMIHHLAHPIRFFREMARILRPGGLLLIHDVHASLLFRAVLHLMSHEGYAFDVDVFNEDKVCTDPSDLWAGNNAIPDLLFENPNRFERHVPWFKVEVNELVECFLFLNSGGVTSKTLFIPLSARLLRLLMAIDRRLVKAGPNVFALGRRVVLRHTEGPEAM